jgi:hypothetical protein
LICAYSFLICLILDSSTSRGPINLKEKFIPYAFLNAEVGLWTRKDDNLIFQRLTLDFSSDRQHASLRGSPSLGSGQAQRPRQSLKISHVRSK